MVTLSETEIRARLQALRNKTMLHERARARVLCLERKVQRFTQEKKQFLEELIDRGELTLGEYDRMAQCTLNYVEVEMGVFT
jgi:hypothetical protein